eukprot:CAMPEP_0172184818 /NCGR_PEP_ID=MMETSP1050-20130122/19802_1 /TAXON_ID=233186 /ORGANISM="Cryptomonas curvata, Strain CCAP979/52" /LENGTH=113 /DNA_ID=CAMNT_0012858689 /DNA_START=74 /DNA_END=415 /DNA_ORIENTATION=+
MLVADSSDPFFQIHTDFSAEPIYKSDYLNATLIPEWAEFQLDLAKLDSGCKDIRETKLNFTVWDHDMITYNDHMGDLSTTIGDLLDKVGQQLELKCKGKPAGHLHILKAKLDE